MNTYILAGKCFLEEVSPKYFEKIIDWRNDLDNNKYLNQTFTATMETQNKWYIEYLRNDSQILYVMIDTNGVPFGTIGLKQINTKERMAEFGNLLVIKGYRGSIEMAECLIGFFEAHFSDLDVMYGNAAKDNKRMIKLFKSFGLRDSDEKFPEPECKITWDDLVSVCIRKEAFYNSKLYKSIKER